MAWSYELDGHWTVAEAKVYPWPCAMNPLRTFKLMPGDVLTKHSGLCMTNLQVPERDLVRVDDPAQMVVRGML